MSNGQPHFAPEGSMRQEHQLNVGIARCSRSSMSPP